MPFGGSFKRFVLTNTAPLFSKLQYLLWVIWSFVGFVFVTSFRETFAVALDATAKLDLARNERDSLLSFLALLLLPSLYVESKSTFSIYRLEQSNIAMVKQAMNASDQLKTLLLREENSVKLGKSKPSNKNELDNVDLQGLKDELELTKTKLQLANMSMGYGSCFA